MNSSLFKNYPFNIKIQIFDDKINSKCKYDINLKRKLIEDMPNIFKNVLKHIDLCNEFKYLERVEPSLSNMDETKQIRLDESHLQSIYRNEEAKKDKCYIYFNQLYCENEYFDYKELELIFKILKNVLEEYLGYNINNPQISLELHG